MTTAVAERVIRYEPQGAALSLGYITDPEVLFAGPAGTGKSRACLELLHRRALDWPGMRGLMVRKTRESMTQSVMETFERHVLDEADRVHYHHQAGEYRYPNGSVIVVRGLDKPSRIMSTEFDLVYVQEATELVITDWESLLTRLRNGVIPVQQIIADCNPDAPTHWLKARCDEGRTLMLESRHEDNPTLYDAGRGEWTDKGAVYLSRLDALTGVRYQRLRLGTWAAAEGVIYDDFSGPLHLVDAMPSGWESWPRFLAVDFGYTNPFVCQWWAQDPDGRLWLYREVYRTQRLVEDHAQHIARLSADEPRPRAVICDHDAEGRATLERHLARTWPGLRTTPANKKVLEGIQAVQARLRPAGDGRPRLFFRREARVERDPALVEAHRPTSTVEELPGYVWNLRDGKPSKDEPRKEDDHGADAMRYAVAHFDVRRKAQVGFA